MRSPLGLVAALLAVALLWPGGAVAKPPACTPSGSVLLSANGFVRVYARRGEAIACAKRTGRKTTLGYVRNGCFPDSCDAGPFRVKGRMVAYARDGGGRDGHQATIHLLDAVAGRELWEAPNGTPEYTEDDERRGCRPGNVAIGIGRTTDLVLRSDGLVAWIAQDQCFPADPGPDVPREVHVRAPGATPSRVAAGTGIDPTSLGLSRAGVHWTQDGRVETFRR